MDTQKKPRFTKAEQTRQTKAG